MGLPVKIEELLTKKIDVNKKMALFLDYDGTLSPIVAHPDLAVMPAETKAILQKLSENEHIFLAIISGRQADNVKKMVGIQNITYAGSHGFEIIYPDGKRYTHTVSKDDKDKLINVQKALKKEVARDGAWVENKGDVLTFHYREVPDEKRSAIIKHAQTVIKSFGLDPTDALCAVEIQPPIKWNKGYAGIFLLESKFGSVWNNETNMIFAGDDVSDEKLIEMFTETGTTFRISSSENVATAASMRLSSLSEVVDVLKWIETKYCV